MTVPNRLDILRGYLLLPHAVPIAVVLGATAAFALVASGGWPGADTLLRLLGAMLGGQIAVGAVNELVDVPLDRISRPDKPIPAQLVTERGARVVAAAGVALMTALSVTFGPVVFALCALGNGIGVAYSLWFKHTIWAWVPYLAALPLIPIWVWTALDDVVPGMFAVYPIGAAAVVAVQLAQSLPDVAADRAAGVRTLAVALGENRARLVCWGALGLAAAIASALAPWLVAHPARVWLAASMAVALVAITAVMWRIDPRRGVLAAFPCIATGAAALGVGWTAALIG